MAYVVNQPTLNALWPELDSIVRSTGPFLACAWCALERSRTVSAPVAPQGLAIQALETLSNLNVLQLVPLNQKGAARSLYEPFAWTYQRPWGDLSGSLDQALTTTLASWAVDCPAKSRLRLWTSLGESEVTAYLENLLRKHRMDESLARQLPSTEVDEWAQLSLGRKRYVMWSGMRAAASELLRSGMCETSAGHVLDREIRTKTKWLIQREQAGSINTTDFCFIPDAQWRKPLIVEVALATFLPVGQAYWLEPAYRWKF